MKPSYCLPGTLSHEEAFELMQLSLRRMLEGRGTARAWRVAAAVWEQTVPYERGWDAIFVEELGRLAKIGERRDVGRAIKKCVGLGALEWEPSSFIPPKGQPGRPSLIGLPGAPKTGANSISHTTPKAGAFDPHNSVISSKAIAVVRGAEPQTEMPLDPGTHPSTHSLVDGEDKTSAESPEEQGWQALKGGPPRTQPERDLPALSDDELLRLAGRAFLAGQRETLEAAKAELARREQFNLRFRPFD